MVKFLILFIFVGYVQSEKWVFWGSHTDTLPYGAVIGGNEEGLTYVIRANVIGALLPGKYSPKSSYAYASGNGGEHSAQTFEVLTLETGEALWEDAKTSRRWIFGGNHVNGQELFICRLRHDGKVIPGYLNPSNSKCHVGYYGSEISSDSYETLKFV